MKIFLIGTPCTGKTTFIKKNKSKYRDFSLFDCDNYMSGESDYRKIEQNIPDHSVYFCGMSSLFDPKKYDNSLMTLIVIIPLDELERNVESRIQKLGGVWTGPFAHFGTIVCDPNFGRNTLIKFSKEMNIPTFSSISQAIDSLYVVNY